MTKEERAAYAKQYREANKEKVAVYAKQYYEANKEKATADARQYYEANKEKVAAIHKQYQRSLPGTAAYLRSHWGMQDIPQSIIELAHLTLELKRAANG